MRPSRGMGDIAPSKMPKGAKKARRDNTNFTAYAKGGSVRLGKPSVEEVVKKAARSSKRNAFSSSEKLRKRGYRG